MKKLLTTLLCLCSCCLATAAVACDDAGDTSADSSTQTAVLGEKRTITLGKGTGYSIESNAIVGADKSAYLFEGTVLSFKIKLGAFYLNSNPLVYVNETPVVPDAEGKYAYAVGEEDITVRVENIKKDVSNMQGSGTMEDAWVVTKPIDLIYIAEQVNSGADNYRTGAYVLANDIDCQGEELKVIGDYNTTEAYFSGSFACASNPDTGATERHSISNFKINSNNSNYVGLFGTVFASNAEGSAQFYGISVDDFVIEASALDIKDVNKSISCGGLIGYGVGVRLFLCDSTNGEINVSANKDYFAFVGGLIGYQQGYYDANYGMTYPAEIAYATVSTDVTVTDGVALYAGGISGYLTTNYPYGATASVHHSYSLGSVSGALRSGGVVGGLGQYSSVSNCYAAGDVSAVSSTKDTNPLLNTKEYCHAYAGGIVGYAENDTVAHDSFFSGKTVRASTVSPKAEYAHEGRLIAGGDEAGTALVDAKKYVVLNCLDDVELTDKNYFTENLNWPAYDWIFAKDTLPTINYEAASDTIQLRMTVVYTLPGQETEIKVGGEASWTEKYFDSSSSSSASYSPIGGFVMGSNDTPFVAQTYEADNGLLSYGIFFDRECTKPVPASYIPTSDITFYVAFADPRPLIGSQATETVYNMTDGENFLNFTLSFKKDGSVVYSDGVTEATATYSFDGTNILIKDARLARYYQDAVVVPKESERDSSRYYDANFELYRYANYNFAGRIDADGRILLWDGTYFTESAPLVYGVGAATQNQSKFVGTWVTKASTDKKYVFYENDSFTLTHYGVKTTGTFEVNGDTLTLSNGKTATFNGDGFLAIDGELFYTKDSFVGTWLGNDYKLTLLGIDNSGVGRAQITDADGYVNDFFYELSETNARDNVVILYYPTYDKDGNAHAPKDIFYGYAYYNATDKTLSLVQPSDATENGFVKADLKLFDDYFGEWVSDLDVFENVEFSFNGMGLYSNGEVTVTGAGGESETKPYAITVENGVPVGSFFYGVTEYIVRYDEIADKLEISALSGALERKDELASLDFVDMNGVRYTFDGRSVLGEGTLTYGDNDYAYRAASDGYDIYDGADKVGSLIKMESHYLLTVNETQTALYLSNKFMGDWAISGAYSLFKIGPTDLNGVIKANFKGVNVDLSFVNAQILTFYYRDFAQNGMPFTYYVFITSNSVTGEPLLALSEYPYLINGGYTVCTQKNELYGEWISTAENGRQVILRFDGTSIFPSYGYAEIALKLDYNEDPTPYLYLVHEKGILMWSEELLSERTWYYCVELIDRADVNGRPYFEKEGSEKVLIRTEVDSLYLSEGKDAKKNAYFFDFDSTTNQSLIFVNDNETATYTYEIKSYNADNTITLEVTEIATGDVYKATFDRLTTEFTLCEKVEKQPSTEA